MFPKCFAWALQLPLLLASLYMWPSWTALARTNGARSRSTNDSRMCSQGAELPKVLIAVGSNDFRISQHRTYGEGGVRSSPAAIWNSIDRRYLIVWEGLELLDSSEQGGIFGQILSATGGDLDTNNNRINESDTLNERLPQIAWNNFSNEFLVLWEGASGINGQVVNNCGGRIVLNDLGISTNAHTYTPAVAWNATDKEFLAVWGGYNPAIGWSAIYGRRLTADGVPIGEYEFQISEVPNPFEDSAIAFSPAVVWNASSDEYLVSWTGLDEAYSFGRTDFRIIGQRLTKYGEEIGSEFVISESGSEFRSGLSKVVWNSLSNGYLVVWQRSPDSGVGPSEILGRRLGSIGEQLDAEALRISHSDIEGSTTFDALGLDTTWNPTANEYFVVWSADKISEDEFEIYGKRLNEEGEAIVGKSIRISDMGPDEDNRFDALYPAVACNPEDNEYLVVWKGDDNSDSLVDDDFQIFGQRLGYVPATGPSQTPTPSSSLEETPTKTPISNFDISPDGGNGRIDANDLMKFLGEMREEFRAGLMFRFADYWLSSETGKFSMVPKPIRLLPSPISTEGNDPSR